MKKILYISPGYNPVEDEHIKYMLKNYPIDFIFIRCHDNISSANFNDGRCFILNFSASRLSAIKKREILPLFICLWKYIRNYNIIISSTNHSLHTKIAFLICKILHKKIYIRVETWYDYNKTFLMKIYHKISDLCLKRANGILVHGLAAFRYLKQKGYSEKKIKIFPRTTGDPLLCLKVIGNAPQKFKGVNYIFVGRLIKLKGVDLLLNAFSHIASYRKDVYLTIVGDGPERQNLVNMAIGLNLNDKIRFTGWINHTDTLNLMYKHQVFVFPSRKYRGEQEGFGLSLVEATGLGLAIVTTDAVGSSYDLVINGYNGYIVKNNSLSELIDGMNLVITNYNDMGKKSREIFEQYFKLYDKVLNDILRV